MVDMNNTSTKLHNSQTDQDGVPYKTANNTSTKLHNSQTKRLAAGRAA